MKKALVFAGAALAAASVVCAVPALAAEVPLDCIPLGGESLLPAPAWLPAPLHPFWTAIVTVPVAGWVMTHVRALLPNDPRIGIVLNVLDKLSGNYGSARNAAR